MSLTFPVPENRSKIVMEKQSTPLPLPNKYDYFFLNPPKNLEPLHVWVVHTFKHTLVYILG